MYVVYSICLYFFCRFFCSHTIKIIFPKKNVIATIVEQVYKKLQSDLKTSVVRGFCI